VVIFGWFFTKMLIRKNMGKRTNGVVLVGCCDFAKSKKGIKFLHKNQKNKDLQRFFTHVQFQKVFEATM